MQRKICPYAGSFIRISNVIIKCKMHWNIKNARQTNSPENSMIWPKNHDDYRLHNISFLEFSNAGFE